MRPTSVYYIRFLLTLINYKLVRISSLLITIAMMLSPDGDVTTMRIHLNELRSRFDQAMRDGESFTMMKEIHMQIKELESCIKVLEWNGGAVPPRGRTEPASRMFREKRYSYIEEPPPLL